MIPLPENAQRVVQALQTQRVGDANLDGNIQFMRDSGLSFLDCMKVVVVLTGCTIGEAKRLVHQSPAWADEKFEREAATDRLIADAELAFGSQTGPENGE